MRERPLILIVDDTPHNVKLLADILGAKDYAICTADSGAEALEQLEKEKPDLVLLDVVMPSMSGYEVCRRIRSDPESSLLPVIMVTALDPDEERINGIEAGADDFLTKPINVAELLGRVRSLLRIREYHDKIQLQAEQLSQWAETLEQRVDEQVAEINRLERLKRFLAPQLAQVIATDETLSALKPHRRHVTVVFLDMRGFTAFAQSAEPEDVMGVLGDYHAAMGQLVVDHEGTLEHFSGDGMMVFFNDPVPVSDPEIRATSMAIAMRDAFAPLQSRWRAQGWELGLGVGLHCGYATLGVIGYEGRYDYAAIGTVTNEAARLCQSATDGQILVSESLLSRTHDAFEAESIGSLELRGLLRPIQVHNILGSSS